MTVIRVSRGAPAPKQEDIRAAIANDRAKQNLDDGKYFAEFSIAGPYQITVDGQELDEYVVWEH